MILNERVKFLAMANLCSPSLEYAFDRLTVTSAMSLDHTKKKINIDALPEESTLQPWPMVVAHLASFLDRPDTGCLLA